MDFLSFGQVNIAIGIALLVIEILVFGFSTLFLLFFGIAFILNGGLILLGILPPTYPSSLWFTGVTGFVLTALAWKPMKHLQSREPKPVVAPNSSFDHTFMLSMDSSFGDGPNYRYSGIEWKVRSEELIKVGTKVKITSEQVGVLWVIPISE